MRVLHEWLLTPDRVAVHRPTRTAVVSDLHLGYAEARRRRGDAIPSDSVADILKPLVRVSQQHAVRKLVIAGDLLEEGEGREALSSFLQWIDQHRMDLIAIIPGNHDRGLAWPTNRTSGLPLFPQGTIVGSWRIVHGEGLLPEVPLVHGHDHPVLRWTPRNRANRPRVARSRFAQHTVNGPCYLTGPGRLVLPAFSKEAAGVNILSLPRWRAYSCHVIAGDRVVDLGEVSNLHRRLNVLNHRWHG